MELKEAMKKARKFAEDLIEDMKKKGIFSTTVPEEYVKARFIVNALDLLEKQE